MYNSHTENGEETLDAQHDINSAVKPILHWKKLQ